MKPLSTVSAEAQASDGALADAEQARDHAEQVSPPSALRSEVSHRVREA